MRYTYNTLLDYLRFLERQTLFTIESTAKVTSYHDFLLSMESTILFNSTCMCLQSIGEYTKKIDDSTEGKLFARYPNTPWKQVIGMRNIISHEYCSIDPCIIFATVKQRLHPLLSSLREILADVESGKVDLAALIQS